MKIFDGTDFNSIKKSLSKALGLTSQQLINEIKLYIVFNRYELLGGVDCSLQNFINHCKGSGFSLDVSNIEFDKVTFFHITSLVDNGTFIREKGLRDLDELLFRPSPLHDYLKEKGIEFFIKNNFPFISINGTTQSLKNLSCNKGANKSRIIARFTKSKSIDMEGIGGFLFLEHARTNSAYQRIKKAPEFLCDLHDCFGRNLADEWKNTSQSVILKCEVDIQSWYCLGDDYKQDDKLEKSYKIAEQGFFFLIDVCAEKRNIETKFSSEDYYLFVAHGIGIPADRIKEFIY
jgi:hypothetical protein